MLLLFPGLLFCQSDYLVTTRGDTVSGKITFQRTGRIEQAQVKAEKKAYYSAMDVLDVFMRGDHYRPIQFSGSVLFMKVLVDGYLSLLAFQPNGNMNYDGRLLQKKDATTFEIPNIGFKKNITKYLSEDEALVSKIDEGKYDRGDIDKIVSEYNARISSRSELKQAEVKQAVEERGKLDLLDSFQSGVEQADIVEKADLLEMIKDLREMIKDNRSVPSYLSKSIREKVEKDESLVKMLDELLGKP